MEEVIKEWIDLRVNHKLTYQEIAARYGVSTSKVYTTLIKNGTEKSKTRTPITLRMIDEWKYLYCKKKLTYSEIAKMYNVKRDTVSMYLRSRGVKTEIRNGQQSKFLNYDIAIYDDYDNLVYYFTSIDELAKILNRTHKNVMHSIHNIANKKAKHMEINHKRYKVVFIKKEEEDEM